MACGLTMPVDNPWSPPLATMTRSRIATIAISADSSTASTRLDRLMLRYPRYVVTANAAAANTHHGSVGPLNNSKMLTPAGPSRP